MTTPSTQFESLVDLGLDIVPQEIEDRAVYEALVNIHNAIEAITYSATGVGAGGFADFLARYLAITTKTASYGLTAADRTIFIDSSVEEVTILLPTASALTGYEYAIKCIDDTNGALVATTAPDKLDDSSVDFSLYLHESIVVRSDGTDWWII